MIDLEEMLKGVKTVAISGHVRPDGDCFGSCMGMYLYVLTYHPEIDAKVYLEDNFSRSFLFVSRSGDICHDYPDRDDTDLFISLDAADASRLGQAQKYLAAAKKTVVIDHHVSNPGFGLVNEIQAESSSTCELVTLLIGRGKLTKEIAEPLYLGIAHDSGVFTYSCTTMRTFETAGWLIGTGIDFSTIIDRTWRQKTYVQNQILGYALMQSILMLDGKVIFSVVHKKEMDFYGVQPTDMDGIVQQLRVTKGVEVAIFLYESGVREYKVSMRSNGKVDVAQIAVLFGGGGHRVAAGCTMSGGVHDAVNNLVEQIDLQLKGTKAC